MSDIFKPQIGTFRTIFLFVGQGDATLMIIPNGESHKYVLVDSNKDEKNNGIDIAEFFKDKIPSEELIFINTHPHNDHVRGADKIKHLIGEVWETGFEPSKEHDDAKKILDDLTTEKNTYYLRGTNKINTLSEDGTEEGKEPYKIGDVDYQVLSPASYVANEVNGDDNKIHEQSGVIKFIYKGKSILMTGDSDKKAWQEHITSYYGEYLKSDVLSASHHGSRSFFKDGEDDKNPFTDHIKKINPTYLVISAPKKSDHDHPHDDALKIYKKYLREENIYNLGEKEQSLIMDIDALGKIKIGWEDLKNNNKSEKDIDVLYRPTTHSNFKPYCQYGNYARS